MFNLRNNQNLKKVKGKIIVDKCCTCKYWHSRPSPFTLHCDKRILVNRFIFICCAMLMSRTMLEMFANWKGIDTIFACVDSLEVKKPFNTQLNVTIKTFFFFFLKFIVRLVDRFGQCTLRFFLVFPILICSDTILQSSGELILSSYFLSNWCINPFILQQHSY